MESARAHASRNDNGCGDGDLSCGERGEWRGGGMPPGMEGEAGLLKHQLGVVCPRCFDKRGVVSVGAGLDGVNKHLYSQQNGHNVVKRSLRWASAMQRAGWWSTIPAQRPPANLWPVPAMRLVHSDCTSAEGRRRTPLPGGPPLA